VRRAGRFEGGAADECSSDDSGADDGQKYSRGRTLTVPRGRRIPLHASLGPPDGYPIVRTHAHNCGIRRVRLTSDRRIGPDYRVIALTTNVARRSGVTRSCGYSSNTWRSDLD